MMHWRLLSDNELLSRLVNAGVRDAEAHHVVKHRDEPDADRIIQEQLDPEHE